MKLPRVSIVVLGYLESNRAFLDACLASVENLDYPKDLLDVVVVSTWYAGKFPSIATPKPGSFSHSVNAGVRALDQTSEHILILSDDTIITRDALKNMVAAAGDADVLMGALSNCDNFWKYIVRIPQVDLPQRFYKRDQLKHAHKMMNAESVYNSGILLTDTLCFYAVLIPRKVWAKVGELDQRFNMGFEDSDYCHRAKLLGVQCAIAMNALIYHAGGASESIITTDMRVDNEIAFTEKWK